MEDMMMQMGMMGMDHMDIEQFKSPGTLVLNNNNELVQYVIENIGEEADENADLMLEQLYDLAMLQHAPLEPEAMAKFVTRSNDIMMLLTK